MSKLSKKELKAFQEFEQKKLAILHDIGLLQTQIHTLSHMFAENNVKSENFKKEIEKKYGPIIIDLKDGSYKKDK